MSKPRGDRAPAWNPTPAELSALAKELAEVTNSISFVQYTDVISDPVDMKQLEASKHYLQILAVSGSFNLKQSDMIQVVKQVAKLKSWKMDPNKDKEYFACQARRLRVLGAHFRIKVKKTVEKKLPSWAVKLSSGITTTGGPAGDSEGECEDAAEDPTQRNCKDTNMAGDEGEHGEEEWDFEEDPVVEVESVSTTKKSRELSSTSGK